MPIPTAKQIADRKRSAKARKAALEGKGAKRIAEGREPDTRAGREARKKANTLHLEAGKRVRTDAQKQIRAANDQVAKLQGEIKALQVIDQENLFDLVIQDREKDRGKEPVDLLKALDLRLQGYTLTAICKECAITPGRLRGLFKRYDLAFGKVVSYRGHRADVLADMQRRILASISDADIKKTPVGTRLLALCQLYDKERLERDLSTANIFNIHDDIAAIKAVMPKKVRPAAAKPGQSVPALPGPARPGK